jgi:hypothetical protein
VAQARTFLQAVQAMAELAVVVAVAPIMEVLKCPATFLDC